MNQSDIQIVNKEQLNAIGVSIVYLFGSYAEGTEHPMSDIDIGVVFKNTSMLENNANSIYQKLYELFTDIFPDRHVDIVFIQRAGLELCFDVVRHGKVIYEKSIEDRLNFEESIFRKYIDFKPILYQFDQAVLERVAND